MIFFLAALLADSLALQIPSAGPPRGEAAQSMQQQQQQQRRLAQSPDKQPTPELLQAAREAEEKERLSLVDVYDELITVSGSVRPLQPHHSHLTDLCLLLTRQVAKGTAVGSALGEFIDPAAIDPSVLNNFF